MKRTAYLAALFAVLGCAHKPIDTREPAGQKIPVEVRGGATGTFDEKSLSGNVVQDSDKYEVAIVGGGMAGVTAALYLTNHGQRVVLLEKEPQLGGIAAWASSPEGNEYDRGAAYWTDPYPEEMELLKGAGLTDFDVHPEKYAIPEPIDAYYSRGTFVAGPWEPESLKQEPSSFELFKFELQRLEEENHAPNQPLEEGAGDLVEYYGDNGGGATLDSMTSRKWIEKMPKALERFLNSKNSQNKKSYAEAKKIYQRFIEDRAAHRLEGPTGMEAVVEFLDLYCRSSLGGTTDEISALALSNFYVSEIIPRYTTSQGTGIFIAKMKSKLAERTSLFTPRLGAPVTKITQNNEEAQIFYNYNREPHMVRARFVVFAAQLRVAPKLIENFAKLRPVQARTMSNLGYSHYSVHSVEVEGHPYRAAYDTWTRPSDYSSADFTDVILGYWNDPKMPGYVGYRDFSKQPPIKDGVLSIYHPLAKEWLNTSYSDVQAKAIALRAVERFERYYSELPPELWHGPLKIKRIITNRWPLAVHIAPPGFFSKSVKIMRQPFGVIYFAHNNLGTAAVEEAMFRGHCAADNILVKLEPGFTREAWSHCPMEN